MRLVLGGGEGGGGSELSSQARVDTHSEQGRRGQGVGGLVHSQDRKSVV